ncbi:MAG: O-antigen ligase family protein [Mesorhizobium sp.]|uniref:O-antigen ligase family protein n=1 Tax=Mesorhizobium sp. TaxID=1871066 RepID=UPI000FE9FAB9|nr:O-antigen ligase family protein [Mesorhizobium sp.]RWP38913.1 MAG: O-antigen ligase family protein [Mesorhizobium sp.]
MADARSDSSNNDLVREPAHGRAADFAASIYALIPALACSFSLIVSPLLLFWFPVQGVEAISRPENQFFWAALFILCIGLAASLRRLLDFALPANIMWFIVYLLVAGLSVAWSIAPEISVRRYVLQVMVFVCAVLPIVSLRRMPVATDHLFVCFGLTALLNLPFLFLTQRGELGHAGFFTGKNLLGEMSALAFMFALHQVSRTGVIYRLRGGIGVVVALTLLIASESKTSLGLALLSPAVAGIIIAASIVTPFSPAALIGYLSSLLIVGVFIASNVLDFSKEDAFLFFFGDVGFTGRTEIWSFALEMIERRPMFGWGFQSFWLVGPDAPSVREAPGFVAEMPHAHNGYLDTILQTGSIGFAVFAIAIFFSLIAVGRVARAEPSRAWLCLSVFLFAMLHNGMESSFFRAFDPLWLALLIVCADIGAASLLLREQGAEAAGRSRGPDGRQNLGGGALEKRRRGNFRSAARNNR